MPLSYTLEQNSTGRLVIVTSTNTVGEVLSKASFEIPKADFVFHGNQMDRGTIRQANIEAFLVYACEHAPTPRIAISYMRRALPSIKKEIGVMDGRDIEMAYIQAKASEIGR